MLAPHYVGENKSDLRGIKPGWYAMKSNGNLVSGPFCSLKKCAEKILSASICFGAVYDAPTRKF
jgi:hypothetical protein